MHTYSVKQLADLAGVSVRTLHHYDQIGILKPATIKQNGYRVYGEKELLILQQIMFFKELDIPLEEIERILKLPNFDLQNALKEHRHLLLLKKKRLDGLVDTIDKTIKRINSKETMTSNDSQNAKSGRVPKDAELYNSFDTKEVDQYAEEAKQRWGHTEAYKQSQERYGKMSQAEKDKVGAEGDKLMKEIAAAMKEGKTSNSSEVQALIHRHYEGLRTFYDPNPEMYKGLGEMYSADDRFRAFYQKYADGLAEYLRDAMAIYADGIKE